MYQLSTFNGISLPVYDPSTEWNTPSVRSAYVQTASGHYDAWAYGRAMYEFPYTLNYSCTIANDTYLAMRNQIDQLRGQVGNWGYLYRIPDNAPTTNQFCQARLMAAPLVRSIANNLHQEISLEFSITEHWRSTYQWRFDEGYTLNSGKVFGEGSQTFTITPRASANYPASAFAMNVSAGGTVDIEDASIYITSAGAIQSFNLYSSGVPRPFSLHFERDDAQPIIPAGGRMHIHGRENTITVNGQAAYKYLRIQRAPSGVQHSAPGWSLFRADAATTMYFETQSAIVSPTKVITYMLDQWI